MLNINKSYFSEDGITSTSANHLCNVAKEKYLLLEEKLNNINFVEESIKLIDSDNTTVIKHAMIDIDVPNILKEIAIYKGFIAYMRTAIKEKDRLTVEVTNYESPELTAFRENQSSFPFPKREIVDISTLEENLSSDEFVRYLALDAEAATIGKAIHNDGSFVKAYKTATKKVSNPITISDTGRDAMIYCYEVKVPLAEINNVFFDLQRKHREIEAKINGIKSSVEEILIQKHASAINARNLEISKYEAMERRLIEESKNQKFEMLETLRSLKIRVPERYKSLIKELS